MNLIITFILLNIANVIIQTVKSIATIKCGKTLAAIINAIAYGLYTIVVVYMVCDLNLWFKVAVVAIANLIGVWVVKYFEEKSRKDKLWKVEATIPIDNEDVVNQLAKNDNISFNYDYTMDEKYCKYNFYCATQKDSQIVKEILKVVNAKYFVSESKIL